jgi:hypothetical protein
MFCDPYPPPEPNQPSLEDIIFLPFSLEQVVKDSTEDPDIGPDISASFKLMALGKQSFNVAKTSWLIPNSNVCI